MLRSVPESPQHNILNAARAGERSAARKVDGMAVPLLTTIKHNFMFTE